MSQLPLRDGSTPKLILQIERRLPRRFGIAATIALLVGTLGFGVVKGGHLAKVGETLSDTRNALANAAGFRITSLSIVGRKQLSQEEVLAIGGVNGRSSLLFLNAAEVRDKLKASPWIADATVLKLYPGRLSIEITERKAFALWQQGGRMSVIAEDGAVLEPYVARRFTNLPLVVGKGAETHARDFLALLAQFPQIKPDVKAVIYVGERRWNLRMNSGLDIRLPEHGVANALTTLTRLDKEDKLLSRDITAIDMRLPDRLTVRLSEEAGKARDELFKKSKRKGTDA
ncbi:MAG: cell division protein FtsQ/DivIB [Pseudomonadota bacterium]